MSDLKARQIETAWQIHNARVAGEDDRRFPGLLQRLAGERNWRCCYCGIRMSEPSSKTGCRATFEHVIPRYHGGSDRAANLVIACYACNQARGSRFFAEHKEALTIFPPKLLLAEAPNQ